MLLSIRQRVLECCSPTQVDSPAAGAIEPVAQAVHASNPDKRPVIGSQHSNCSGAAGVGAYFPVLQSMHNWVPASGATVPTRHSWGHQSQGPKIEGLLGECLTLICVAGVGKLSSSTVDACGARSIRLPTPCTQGTQRTGARTPHSPGRQAVHEIAPASL